ncbi:hem peroxidase [Arabidopsis suecica]|uniref:peroxidase n=1 Tax=Arabidopsis suecica TaxID=45249 RepID=A0A8T1ZDF3_ARASU|nr:hem peroxidase [Arabidopsis suecica]
MAVKISTISVLILSLALLSLGHCCYGQLRVGFYSTKCPNVENIVSKVVGEAFIKDSSIAPAMIRLYFHDCFSNGCDASLLLDGTSSEKKASPNLSVRGYELIDNIKSAIEQECDRVVSCADIIALATRDLVTLASGGKTRYEIPTGRLDGKVSLALLVDLPSPRMTVSQTAAKFAERKLSVTDMVLLLGGHTIGVAHCSFVMDRLYNFQNTQQPDPSMDPKLVQELRLKCPKDSSTDGIINLDQNFTSSNTVDVSFYKQINFHRGILHIDQQLAIDGMTSKMVTDIANGNDFLARFGQAMVNLGSVRLITKAKDGEIRRSCRSCNNPSCV